MKNKDKIEKVIKDFCAAARTDVKTTSQMDGRIINDALTAHEKSKQTKPALSKPNIWRIIMKNKMTKFTTAAAAAVFLVAIFLFFSNSQKTLYAQIVKAFEQARSIHVVMTEYRDGHQFKDHEIWYDSEEGVREEERFESQTQIRIDNKQYEWRYKIGDQLVAQINSYRDTDEWAKNLYEWLRFNPERNTSGDKVIGGVPCEMYTLSIPGQEAEKVNVWIDEKNRVLELVQEEQRDGQEIGSMASIEYDIEIDKSLFLPNFDSTVKIVGPRELIEEQFPLDTTIFKRESLGFVFAVHELEFGSDFKYIVCSNRLTEQTRGEISNGHPSTYYGGFDLFGRYDEFGMYSDTSDEPILLAEMRHDGIEIKWYILIPGGSKAKQVPGCDIDVLVNVANQLKTKLKAERLPIKDKFRLNITPSGTKDSLLSSSQIANQVYSLGKEFDPIVHSFALTTVVTEPDGNKSLAWKKPVTGLSEEEYIRDIENRIDYYLNQN